MFRASFCDLSQISWICFTFVSYRVHDFFVLLDHKVCFGDGKIVFIHLSFESLKALLDLHSVNLALLELDLGLIAQRLVILDHIDLLLEGSHFYRNLDLLLLELRV